MQSTCSYSSVLWQISTDSILYVDCTVQTKSETEAYCTKAPMSKLRNSLNGRRSPDLLIRLDRGQTLTIRCVECDSWLGVSQIEREEVGSSSQGARRPGVLSSWTSGRY